MAYTTNSSAGYGQTRNQRNCRLAYATRQRRTASGGGGRNSATRPPHPGFAAPLTLACLVTMRPYGGAKGGTAV